MSSARPRIVVGVTSPMSLLLMQGLPERLQKDGWAVTVVSSPGPELERLGQNAHLTVHALSMARDPNLAADLTALVAWWRFLRALKPDVVLVGTPKAGMLGVLAGMLARVPVRIYHLRGLRLETSGGVSRLIFRAVESLTLAAATSSIAVSRSLRERVISLRLGRGAKMTVLGLGSSNGVDVDRFHPAAGKQEVDASRRELGLVPAVPVIGYVGRIHPDKGLVSLIEASALLTKQGVSHQLLVVGGVDHPSASDLLTRFRALEAPVSLPGSVPDPAPYYQIMDIHCLPSLREGFPNAVLEASASGVLTVTTDATGAVDSVVPGETGYIVPAANGRALADALERVLSDADEMSRLGENARRWVVENYARSDVQANLANFLRERLDG